MKKRIWKQLERIKALVAKIDEWNEYVNDNTYSSRGYDKQFSFGVKARSYWLGQDDVEKIAAEQGIIDTELLLEEFNDERLSGICYHEIESAREWFRDCQKEIDHPWNLEGEVYVSDISFLGSNGGHLCLGSVGSFELDYCSDTEIYDTPFFKWIPDHGMDLVWPDDVDELIALIKDHDGVTTQKEVYQYLRSIVKNSDLEDYAKEKATRRLRVFNQLEQHIEDWKKGFPEDVKERLKEEIAYWISENQTFEEIANGFESGTVGEQRFDYVASIDGDDIITNRNARVPLDVAIRMIEAIKAGVDIVNRHIGHYTVNKVFKTEKDWYVKIGCHNFIVSQTESKIKSLSNILSHGTH